MTSFPSLLTFLSINFFTTNFNKVKTISIFRFFRLLGISVFYTSLEVVPCSICLNSFGHYLYFSLPVILTNGVPIYFFLKTILNLEFLTNLVLLVLHYTSIFVLTLSLCTVIFVFTVFPLLPSYNYIPKI